MAEEQQPVEPQGLPAEAVPDVQLVVGSRGLFVHLFAVRGGQTLAEVGMTPSEALQVAAALNLHAAKATGLTSQKPNA